MFRSTIWSTKTVVVSLTCRQKEKKREEKLYEKENFLSESGNEFSSR